MTSELLSAPNSAGYRLTDSGGFIVDVGVINFQLENPNPLFTQMLNVLENTGRCSVSPICSIPDQFHSQTVLSLTKNLRIFYNTVIKHISKDFTDENGSEQFIRHVSIVACRWKTLITVCSLLTYILQMSLESS